MSLDTVFIGMCLLSPVGAAGRSLGRLCFACRYPLRTWPFIPPEQRRDEGGPGGQGAREGATATTQAKVLGWDCGWAGLGGGPDSGRLEMVAVCGWTQDHCPFPRVLHPALLSLPPVLNRVSFLFPYRVTVKNQRAKAFHIFLLFLSNTCCRKALTPDAVELVWLQEASPPAEHVLSTSSSFQPARVQAG